MFPGGSRLPRISRALFARGPPAGPDPEFRRAGGRRHEGLANYTIGQRKGLGIAGAEPFYVLAKEVESNVLRVGKAEELGRNELCAGEVNWIAGCAPGESFTAGVKIRYKAKESEAEVCVLEDGRVRVRFMQPLRDITPGQRVVFYQGDVCLGGGVILG